MKLRFRGGAHPVALFLCLLCWGWYGGAQEPQPELEFPLQPKEFPKGWVLFSADEGREFSPTWQISRDVEPKDATLICQGKPDGYIRTEKAYDNYELGLEWMFPTDPNGNSGILLHVVEKDMIWPKCIQLQMHRPTAGSVFPHSGAKTDNTLAPAKEILKPIGEWNSCVVTCEQNKISVTMNGKKLGEVTGCVPQKGSIGLQSEGSEIHFRRLWIRPLK